MQKYVYSIANSVDPDQIALLVNQMNIFDFVTFLLYSHKLWTLINFAVNIS